MRPDEPESTDDDVAVAVVMEPEKGTPGEEPGAPGPEARGGAEDLGSAAGDPGDAAAEPRSPAGKRARASRRRESARKREGGAEKREIAEANLADEAGARPMDAGAAEDAVAGTDSAAGATQDLVEASEAVIRTAEGDVEGSEGAGEASDRTADGLASPGVVEETAAALDDGELLRAVAALVFASPEPLTERKLAALCAGEGPTPAPARIRATLDALAQRLSESGLPLELRSIAGGWRILTAPETGPVVQRLFEARKAERISPAALETLAIVAYRQPVTKAEIEAIRGVQAGPVLRALVDRDLIKVAGRADVPGHPLQYATTKNFLDRFGLSGLDDLPRDSELAR